MGNSAESSKKKRAPRGTFDRRKYQREYMQKRKKLALAVEKPVVHHYFLPVAVTITIGATSL
jgi:hypothetical protein